MTETFKYDALDRLDTVMLNGVVSRMVYDSYGRMLGKTSAGAVVFENASYDDRNKPHAVRGAWVNGAVLPNAQGVDIAYTMHDKVRRIDQDRDVLTFDYGYARQRIRMTESVYAYQATTWKMYVGNCEYEHGLNRNRRLTYLSGPLGVFAVYEELGPLYKGGGDDSDDSDDSDEGEDLTAGTYPGSLYYLHRDHLGSVTTVTNASGGIVQELSYDAWGNLRNPTTWSGSYTGVPRFDRGFTGHEHHRHFGLINMNGRMYDPVMSCFLSVDSYVQDPENPQNFNRYAYCLNNPLKYTDPDEEWVHVAVGALFGGVINLSANWNNCEGFWQYAAAFGAGAVNGALSVAAPGWGSLSIGAMKITSPALKSIVGGVVGGACVGGLGGVVGGMVLNSDITSVLDAGLNGALSGVVIGGISGVTNGIIESHANHINF